MYEFDVRSFEPKKDNVQDVLPINEHVQVSSMFKKRCLSLFDVGKMVIMPMQVRKNSVMMHMSNILFQLDQHYPAAVGTFIT